MITIIKMYDTKPIYNVLITKLLKPERIVYIIDNECENEKEQNTLSYFDTLNPPVEAVFYKTDTANIESIIAALGEIYEKYTDCILDVTGGEPLTLLAAGIFYARKNIPVCFYNKKQNKYINVFKSENIIEFNEISSFLIEDFIRLTGGSMAGHGHFYPQKSGLSDKETEIICNNALSHQKHWKAMVLGLQHTKNTVDELSVSVPSYVAGSKVQMNILNDLSDSGLISLLNTEGNRISFKYKNSSVKKCMTDTGLWLELHIYMEAKKQKYFSDLEMSVLIDWDGESVKEDEAFINYEHHKNRPVIVPNTMNEIDVIMVKGISPLFVSCKAGNYNAKELKNEASVIHTIAKRFGGQSAKPVLVTTSDLSVVDPFLYKRCEDMGVYILEGSDLGILKTGKNLVEISENKFKFKEIQ